MHLDESLGAILSSPLLFTLAQTKVATAVSRTEIGAIEDLSALWTCVARHAHANAEDAHTLQSPCGAIGWALDYLRTIGALKACESTQHHITLEVKWQATCIGLHRASTI